MIMCIENIIIKGNPGFNFVYPLKVGLKGSTAPLKEGSKGSKGSTAPLS